MAQDSDRVLGARPSALSEVNMEPYALLVGESQMEYSGRQTDLVIDLDDAQGDSGQLLSPDAGATDGLDPRIYLAAPADIGSVRDRDQLNSGMSSSMASSTGERFGPSKSIEEDARVPTTTVATSAHYVSTARAGGPAAAPDAMFPSPNSTLTGGVPVPALSISTHGGLDHTRLPITSASTDNLASIVIMAAQPTTLPRSSRSMQSLARGSDGGGSATTTTRRPASGRTGCTTSMLPLGPMRNGVGGALGGDATDADGWAQLMTGNGFWVARPPPPPHSGYRGSNSQSQESGQSFSNGVGDADVKSPAGPASEARPRAGSPTIRGATGSRDRTPAVASSTTGAAARRAQVPLPDGLLTVANQFLGGHHDADDASAVTAASAHRYVAAMR